jgi:PAS domain S-box-containing protein
MNQETAPPPQISLAAFTVNSRWEITAFSQAALELLGLEATDIIGRNCHDFFSRHARFADLFTLCSTVTSARGITSFTIVLNNPDTDHHLAVLVTAIPLPDSTGNLSGAIITFQETSQSFLVNQLVLDSLADGVFTVDINWRITSFNRSAEALTGWTQAEAIGKSCREIFHSNVCGDACLLGRSIRDGRTIVDKPIYIEKKDGTIVPVSISAAPFLDHEGKVIGGVETFRDTTSSIKNHIILDSIADGVFTVDRNWQITSFNRAAELITGWTADDAVGRFCSDIFHSSICGKNCAIALSLYSGKPISNLSITITNARGDNIPISISAAPLIDAAGNIIGGVETFRDLTAITILRKQLTKNYTFAEIISKSAAMQRIFNILPDIARSPSTVLISGESGTGKELVARAIFNASNRADKPFVIVNCGALPETLLESELFGYKAGAFTDAKKDKIGRFAAAETGTLFLDEIGDIPHSLQVKLLRVLQNRVYEPLGSNTSVRADARIITATNRNLQDLVQQGLFREDLFYRLNVVKIHLPPLRERKEDIPLLTDHFIRQFSSSQGKDIVGIASTALNILMRYDFPGNIRELENIIEYAFILCDGGYIQPQHLPEPFYTGDNSPKAKTETAPAAKQTLDEIEKQAIYLALEKNRWGRMDTCRELGISKDTLRRKIERYGLKNTAEDDERD